MSSNPIKTYFDLYREAADMVLTPEERAQVRVVFVKKPGGSVDLEGPEHLKNKVREAFQAKLKQSNN